ncbi:MAG: hypothetical protein FIA97_09035 [Methylococcaceae bacterium]|nr:hypothetical protein [Methylococcaceae bacterium]
MEIAGRSDSFRKLFQTVLGTAICLVLSAPAAAGQSVGSVYTHGSAATLDTSSRKAKVEQNAEGTLVTVKPGGQAIVIVPVSVPTIMLGQRTQLLSLEPRFDGNATIVNIDAIDGQGLIQSFKEDWTGKNTGSGPFGSNTEVSANFDQPLPNLYTGLVARLTISNTCNGSRCGKQQMLITAVGATYYYETP